MNENNTNYYLIRTSNYKGNHLTVGWGQINLTQDFSTVKEKMCNIYLKNSNPISVGKTLNQVKRFGNIIHGDVIIIPGERCIYIAKAIKTQYIFSNNEFDNNIIYVEYFTNKSNERASIPRDELSEKLQRRLRMRGMTIGDLFEFKDEIDEIIKSITIEGTYSRKSTIEKNMEKQASTFKENLLKNIQEGYTNLKSGGIGLEELVKELLIIEGYSAKILSKRYFPDYADADIIATKHDLILGESKVLIQVKHHNGYSNIAGVDQLCNINKENYDYDYLVLITSAQLTNEAYSKAQNAGIRTMEGPELIDWIYNSLNKISNDTLFKLNISLVPQFLPIKNHP